ncbi:MAG: hypothetical protein MR364_03030 [Oscillospiraceae bacterium]|nr:hypothetical protein [Oscillospiraceae bacterium]
MARSARGADRQTSPPALNLYNLPKNLTTQYAHNLCAVLPVKFRSIKKSFEV